MDPPPSPFVRVERTFWTVWNYITDAVGRLLRPEATDIGNNDASSSLENTVDREADTDSFSYRELEVRIGGEDDEQATFATDPVVDTLRRPSVAWQQPIAEPESENVQCAVESSRGGDSLVSQEGEGSRHKQVAQAEDEDVSLPISQDFSGTGEEVGLNNNKGNDEELQFSSENVPKEELPAEPNEGKADDNIIMSPNNVDTELNEHTDKCVICSGNEEVISTEIIPEDKHELNEVRMPFQAIGRKEAEQKLHGDQSKDSKHTYSVSWTAEENIGNTSTPKDVIPREERDIHLVDLGGQRKDEAGVKTNETGVKEELERSDGVSELIPDSPSVKNETCFTPDEGIMEADGEDVKEPPLIGKDILLLDDTPVMRGPATVAPDAGIKGDLQMMYEKSGIVWGGEISVIGHEQMVGESIERSENYRTQAQGENEDEGIRVTREQEIRNEDGSEIKDNMHSNKILNLEIEQEYSSKAFEIDENNANKHTITEDVDVCKIVTDNESQLLPGTVYTDGDQSDETDVYERVTKANNDTFEQSAETLGVSEYVNLENMRDNELPRLPMTMSTDIEKDKTEKEGFSSKEETVSSVEETLSPIPVKLEGIDSEEINQGLKDISPGICLGPVVMPLESEAVACDITLEEVPEHNNGLEVDEDTTQRILELADFQDNWTTQLPEKAESQDPESLEALRNEAGRLLVMELEEEQNTKVDSSENIDGYLDMIVEPQDEKWGLTNTESPKESEKAFADQVTGTMAQVSWHSFLPEAELLDAPVKADPRQSESASEPAVVVPSGENKEPLVELELYGETADSTTPEAGRTDQMEDGSLIDINEKTTVTEEEVTELSIETVGSSELENTIKTVFSDDSIDTDESENIHQEGFHEANLKEQYLHVEAALVADTDIPDGEIKVQDVTVEGVGISDIETEEKAPENESDNENNKVLHPLAVQNTAGLTKEARGIENVLIVTSEPSRDHTELSVGSEDTKHELSEKQLEVSKEENTAIESLDKLADTETEPKDTVNGSMGTEENTGRPDIGHGNEMNEEMLDMWIETVLPNETDDLEPKILIESTERDLVEEPVHALYGDIETPPSGEELPKQFEKTQLVKPHTKDEPITESVLVGEVEVSGTSVSEESVFSDRSIDELGPSENEVQQLMLSRSETSQGTHETAGHMLEAPETVTSRSPVEPSEHEGGPIVQTTEAGHSYVEEDQFNYTTHTQLIDASVALSEGKNNDNVDKSSDDTDPIKVESAETRFEIQKEISPETSDSELSDQNDKEEADGTEAKSINTTGSLLKEMIRAIKEEPLDNASEMQETDSASSSGIEEAESREGGKAEALSGETVVRDKYGLFVETVVEPQDQFQDDQGPSLDEADEQTDEPDGLFSGLKKVAVQGLVGLTPRTKSEDHPKVSTPALDFTHEKSRIAVKNPYVRPPKDPRSLLHMPSLEPTPPQPSAHLPGKRPAGVPMGGLGVGIKLPGIGAGFPVLKKTPKGVRDGKDTESISQKADTESERTDESPKQEQEQPERKPKWMPPRHPGFGNPLMAELKNKLKKTTDE